MPERRADPGPEQPALIAYVTHSFPQLTETFVYREVRALERRGLRIANFAIWRPGRRRAYKEALHLLDSTSYVFPLSWPKLLGAHLYFVCAHPWRYLSTLLFVLARSGQTRKRTFLHFCEAVYLALDMKRQDVNHVHAHFAINAAAIALIISRLLDITYSLTAHNSLFTDRVLLREKLEEATFVVAISEFTRRFIAGWIPGGKMEDKTYVVHCGLSLDEFSPPEAMPADPIPVLLFVAQLVERKGAPILVEACRILAQRKVPFQCIIAGDGPERPLLERMVRQYDLEPAIRLTGALPQSQVKALLSQADLFVLPCITASSGDMDGIPVVLMEAMAMEIPTVSTSVSGIPELIEQAVSGLLVAEKDAEALADAVECLLENEELRLRLGRNGRLKVMHDFDIEKTTTQLADLFRECLKARSERPEGRFPRVSG